MRGGRIVSGLSFTALLSSLACTGCAAMGAMVPLWLLVGAITGLAGWLVLGFLALAIFAI